MKKQNQFHKLLLTGLTLIGVSLATPSASADQEGTKPLAYRGEEVVKEPLPPGTWDDDFLNMVRDERGLEDLDQYIEVEGWINGAGRISGVGHQIIYLTSTGVDWYQVSYITSANGDEFWSAVYGSVDGLTGEIEGVWFILGGTGRFEGATGDGQIVASYGPDGLLVEFEATGTWSTVGSNKR